MGACCGGICGRLPRLFDWIAGFRGVPGAGAAPNSVVVHRIRIGQALQSGMYNRPMKCWKHWTAVLLLVVCGAATAASVGAGFCTADTRNLIDVGAATDEVDPNPTQCPLATLAEFAATPIVFAMLLPLGVDVPAYVWPLLPSRLNGIDPEPPVKPPAA